MNMFSRMSMPRLHRRVAPWLAALMATAAIATTAPAEAQTDRRVLPFSTGAFPPPGFVPSSAAAMSVPAPYRLGFHKTAHRFSCDYVSYEVAVRLDMDPGLLADGPSRTAWPRPASPSATYFRTA